MATAKRKKMLAAATILQPKRSRKRSEKWDNNEKNMVEDMDFMTCQISAILSTDRLIKSPGMSPVLVSCAIFRVFFELLR